MKKLLPVLILSFLMLASCVEKTAPPATAFTASAIISGNGLKLKADLTSGAHGLVTIKIRSPRSLKGMRYRFKNGSMTISRGKMRIDTEPDYLPSAALPRVLYSVLSSLDPEKLELKSIDNSVSEYTGACPLGKFSLRSEQYTGVPKSLCINGVEAEFSNVEVLGSDG